LTQENPSRTLGSIALKYSFENPDDILNSEASMAGGQGGQVFSFKILTN
jgi:hypothetical protein